MQKVRYILVFILVCFIASLHVVPVAAEEKLSVAVNQSRVMVFERVSQVAVANPEIADVAVVSSAEIMLIGKAPGHTTIHVWSNTGRHSFIVEVGNDDTHIANAIKMTLGYTDIRVSKVNKTIILEGTVNDRYQKSRAEQVASAYGEKVVNLLEITRPVQVKIEAKVIEINREKVRDVGIKWGYNPDQAPGVLYAGQSFVGTNGAIGQVLGDLGTFGDINARLNMLVKEKAARILSQPNMITLSGEKANIMVGGEIPIPVTVDENKVTIEWKEYGIKLEIAPEVNSEGLINSKVKAEASSLDWNATNRIELGRNLKIPPLRTRKAESTIALASGQTMALGGLIATETSQDIHKVPFLGDIPVLGNLFKSKAFNKGETELIILITPTIVNPTEYIPQSTKEMKDALTENPWGGDTGARKN